MTEPGQASTVGAIIAYLRMNRDDWTRGKRATDTEAAALGRLNPNIRISTNAGDTVAKLGAVATAEKAVGKEATAATAPTIGLWSALAAIAPAAAPIGAVALGGLAGLIPVIATVSLGISGISEDFKSGALEGTKYGADIQQISGYLDQLKQTAASGLLDGLDQALDKSHPLFDVINSDTALMSQQIGHIVAGGAPALLTILTQLNPLFVTFGNVLERGATGLEHWAQTSTGVSSFVGYTQAQLPSVIGLLGSTATLIDHVAVASANSGPVILGGIGLLVRVLDALPIGVLQVAIPLLTSGYLALKAYQGIDFIVNRVTRSVESLGTAQTGAALRAEAAKTAQIAAAAETAAAEQAAAAAVAEAEAEKLVALRESQAGVAQWGAAYDEVTVEVIAGAQAQAFALREAAATAALTAAEEVASAEAAAAAVTAAGAEASAGWAAMLGPAAAILLGVTLLVSALHHSDKAAEDAAKSAATYASSVRESTDALNSANVAQTNKNLSDNEAFTILSRMHAANQALGVSYADLTSAVNGSDAQFQRVQAAIEPLTHGMSAQSLQAKLLLTVLSGLRSGLASQIQTQKELNDATAQSLGITNDQATYNAALFRLFGDDGVAAFLAARQALDKVTASQEAQSVQSNVQAQAAQNVAAIMLGPVTGGFNAASTAGQAFVQALQTYAASAGGTVDRGALLAAGLVAMQGDYLNAASAAAAVTTANDTLTGAFQEQADAAENAGRQVTSAQQSIAQAADQETSSERQLASAQRSALDAQKALTQARVDAKQQLEDLNNQVIDGALSQRRAVLDLQNAKTALAKSPTAENKLAYDEAVQRLSEVQLANQRLAVTQKQANAAGVEGSQQVVSAQQQVQQALQAVTDAEKSRQQAAQSAATAQQQLSDATAAQAKTLRDSEKAAIDLKTGYIDVTKAGAGPLIQQLQNIQEAAQKHAQAVYDAEVKTKGLKAATEDATTLFKTETYDALVKDSDQLGVTKDEAQRLADRYLSMPKSFQTQAQLLGADGTGGVIDVLNQIGTQLSILTGTQWKVDLSMSIGGGQGVTEHGEVYAGATTGSSMVFLTPTGHNAAGTGSWTGGWTWLGENGPELAKLPAGTQIKSNSESRRMVAGYDGASAPVIAGDYVQVFQNPLQEPASVSGPKGARRAVATLGGLTRS